MAHILLAEDDESLRKFLAAALVKAGHTVTDFGDGSDAWECLQGFTFDLLLTDIVMPGMDGIELAKRAAERNGALKIMFITGFAAVALHPARGRPNRPRSSPNPSICARSWWKWTACSRPEQSSRVHRAHALPCQCGGPPRYRGLSRAGSSAGEHYVDIVGVTGSIPVPPTT